MEPHFRAPIERLRPWAGQPRDRSSITGESLDDLAASIREQGLLEPIIVREVGNQYEIIAGERRWRAAQKAGLHDVPVLVRTCSDQEALLAALAENVARQDLCLADLGAACQKLVEAGMTVEDVCKKIGARKASVTMALDAAKLSRTVLDLNRTGKLNDHHLIVLRPLAPNPADALRWAHRAVDQSWSATELKARMRLQDKLPTKAKPVGIRDIELRISRRLGCKAELRPIMRGIFKLYLHGTLEQLDALIETIDA